MKRNFKRICSLLVALVLCFSFMTSASAAEVEKTSTENADVYTFEVSKDSTTLISRSSVSGYNQKYVTSNDGGLIIECNGSGIGGMGITIETSCSQGTFDIDFTGGPFIGNASTINGTITSNDHLEIKNLMQNNIDEYLIAFRVPAGKSVFVKVWIYG